MPFIFRNRTGAAPASPDDRLFLEVMEDYGPFIEFRMNEASGDIINSGSAGSAYDANPSGTPNYQAGAGDARDELNNFYIDFDGAATSDSFHRDNAAEFINKSEGALVIAYRCVSGATTEIFVVKPEIGTPNFFGLQLTAAGLLKLLILNGTDQRAITVGDTPWDASADNTNVTHIAVIQYDAVNKHRMFIDGHQVNLTGDFLAEDVTIGGGNDLWWDGLPLSEIFSVSGRAEYDGAGNYVSSLREMDGRVEYVGLFDFAFTPFEVDDMFKRFYGGASLYIEGVDQRVGVDSVQKVSAAANVVTNKYVAMKRMYNHLLLESIWDYTSDVEANQASDFFSNPTPLNDFSIDHKNFAWHWANQNASSALPIWTKQGPNTYEEFALGTGSSEAWFGAWFDPWAGQGALYVQVFRAVATAFSENFPLWYWDGISWVRNVTPLNIQPTSLVSGASRKSVFYSDPRYVSTKVRWLGMATLSVNGSNPAIGGGGIHIYIAGGQGPNFGATREPLAGYAPTAQAMRTVQFFNDGIDDYAIALVDGPDAGSGVTGAQDGIGVFRRIAGVWTAQNNLINNGVSIFPAGANYVFQMLIVEDDMYVSMWASPAPLAPLPSAVRHLKWNGTFFALQADPFWPYPVTEGAGADIKVMTQIAVTDDLRGIIMTSGGGTTPVVTPTWLAYDRDLVTGALTQRPNYYDDTSVFSDLFQTVRSLAISCTPATGTPATAYAVLINSLNPDYWYRFTEVSGDVFNIGSVAGGDLTISGTPTRNIPGIPQTGQGFQAAMRFNSSSGDEGNSTDEWAGQTGTVIFLVQFNNNSLVDQWLGGTAQGFDEQNVQFRIVRNISDEFTIQTFKANANGAEHVWQNNDDAVPINEYHLHAIVQDVTGGPKYYIDGVEVTYNKSGPATTPDEYWFGDYAANAMTFMDRAGVGSGNADGDMDELIYFEDTVLTPAEILAIAQSLGLA